MNYKVIADSFKNRKNIRKKVMFTAFAVGLSLSVSIMAQVPSYIPSNGLVGWWPFNGNANDESGNGNNGTVNGATLTTDRFGNIGKAYSFDGVDDYVICSPNQINLINNSFSWALWLKKNSLALGANIIVHGNASSNSGFHLGFTTNSFFRFGFYNNDLDEISSNTNLSDWYFYSGTYDASTNQRNLYVNGVLSANDISASDILGNGDLYLGGITNINGWDQSSFDGKLDDIGLWNRALTQQEISDLYNANICYDYVTVTDTLVINTGITGYNPITYLNTLKIWPNPSNDHITIDAGNLATMNGYSIKIEDAQGQQVFQNAVNQQQFYIDITTWGGNGLYFVRIIDPQGNTVDIKKIVLQ